MSEHDASLLEDELDAEFERLGRAAAAELRAAAPAEGPFAVERSLRRRRRLAAGGAVTALLGVVAVGVALLTRPGTDEPPGVTVPPVPSTTAERLGAGSSIVFEHAGSRGTTLGVVRGDGTGRRELVTAQLPGPAGKPFWSPDGQQVVFVMPDPVGDALWTVGADGSGPEQLLPCDDPCIALDDPSWSPDGRWIAYTRLEERGDATVSSLERIDVETGSVQVLAAPVTGVIHASPRWSPDSSSLVVEIAQRNDGLDGDVVAVGLSVAELGDDGVRVLRALTTPAAMTVTPDWSPAGDTIVFAAPARPGAVHSELFLIDPAGGEQVRLTSLGSKGWSATFPSFDATGTQIVFSIDRDDGNEATLAVVDVATGTVTETLGGEVIAGSHARVIAN